MTSKEILKQFIEFKGVTVTEFCKKTGLSNGYFTNAGAIGSDKIHNILSAYPDLSVEWLITGKGNMIKEKQLPLSLDDNYKEKYISLFEENRQLHNENKQLRNLIGANEETMFQTSKLYNVAESDNKGLVEPEKELKDTTYKGS